MGREIKDIMDGGDLVSDEVMTRLVREKVLHDPGLANGFILDGYPRTSQQAKDLDGILAEAGIKLDFVLYVNTSPDAIVERLKRRLVLENRPDDQPEVVRERMKVYQASTQPVIDYYNSRHALKEVDNNGTMEEVVRGWEAIFNEYSSGAPDQAMAVQNPGGIDLNTVGMNWKVRKDGNGVEMKVDPAMIERIRREGIDSLTPVIFRVMPMSAAGIWAMIGLEPPKKQEERLAGV